MIEPAGENNPLPPILIVEDNLLLRKVLEEMLRQAGYAVTAAENGKQALEIFSQSYYPIVITDWVMPVMDGLDLCRAIREQAQTRYCYLILVTAQDAKEHIITGLDAGADEYLVKPINEAELTARLKTARRILNLEASLQKSLEEVRALSLRDALTGTFNRRYLDDALPREIKRAHRYGHPLSVIMVDIDHFKKVNDMHGHRTGDQILKLCGRALMDSIRHDLDWVARYGGEEFTLVLPETNQEGALVVAERLRNEVAELIPKVRGFEIRITVSLGVATTLPVEGSEVNLADSLLERADQALYMAKDKGRNRVEFSPY